MKLTLIQMVQDILSDMNSFNVNNIHEHQESRQVVDIIESTFYTVTTYRYWPAHYRTVRLEGAPQGTDLMPAVLVMPSNVIDLDELYYNKRKLHYKDPQDFLKFCMELSTSTNNNFDEYDLDGTPLACYNGRDPSFFTILSKGNGSGLTNYVVMDAYNKEDEDVLLASKSLALGQIAPEFKKENTFVPDLPDEAFPYLLAEAKARAFIAIKGVDNPSAVADAARLRSRLAVEKGVVQSKDTYPNYGRL